MAGLQPAQAAVTEPFINVKDHGVLGDGLADDTVVLQSVIDANPRRTLYLPSGVYKFSSLHLGKGQTLRGDGWQDYRDRYTLLGTAGWLVAANFGGTIMRSIATVGTAITIVDTEVNGGGLCDLALIGPGTGSSLGVMVGSAAVSVVHPVWRNVKIGNFSAGLKSTMMNEGSFYDLTIHGCAVGLELAAYTSQNDFHMLDLQRNVTGCIIAGNSYANAFYSPIGQSNTGTAFIIAGIKTAMYNPYFENNGSGAVEITASGWGNAIHDPFCSNASDGIVIRAGATDCSILGWGWQGTIAPVINEANGTYLHGRFPLLTDTGYGTVVIDYQRAGTPFSNWQPFTPSLGGQGWALGNGSATGSFTAIGRTVHFSGKITFGSTTQFGNSSPTISIPYAAAVGRGLMQAFATRIGVNMYTLAPRLDSPGSCTLWAVGASGSFAAVTASNPAAWKAGDSFEFSGTYERS